MANNSAPKLSFIQILRRLIPFARPYKGWVGAAVITAAIGAGLAQVEPLVMRYLIDGVTRGDVTVDFGLVILIEVAAVLVIKEILALGNEFLQRYAGEVVKAKVGADLFARAFDHTLSLDVLFFEDPRNEPGRLVQRIDRGAEALARALKNLLADILPLLATAVAALVVMFTVNVWVGAIACAVIPVYFVLSYRQAQEQEGVRIGIQEAKEKRSSAILSTLFAIRVIKSFVEERFEMNRMRVQSDDLAAKEIKHHRTNHLYDAGKLFADQLGASVVVLFSAWLVLNQEMTVGAIALHLLLYRNVTAPIRHLHRIYDEHNEAVAFAQGFFALLEQRAVEEPGDNKEAARVAGEVAVRNVTFGYDPLIPVLKDVTLELKVGSVTALVGLSGAGKSTLAGLLPKFHEPQVGEVWIDGKPLRAYDVHDIRRSIGMVMQNTFLIPGSVEENVRYGTRGASATDVAGALAKAELTETVEKLPLGLDTPAAALSGGERQRIAIARVFLKNPPILILDEPTASLDANATDQIKKGIDNLKSGRTVLVISHNLPLIMDSDAIYVIKDGRIIETGTHDSLVRQHGHYFDLINSNIESMNLKRLLGSVA